MSEEKEEIKRNIPLNILQGIFIVVCVVWVGTSIYLTLEDILWGHFQHTVLSVSFIFSIVTGIYLSTRQRFIDGKTKKPKKEPCKTCGKGKTKK